jgi:hypothetical protein
VASETGSAGAATLGLTLATSPFDARLHGYPGRITPAEADDAILVGGPRDRTRFASEQAGLVELEIDGMIHRYIRTTATRERDGRSYLVYNYDGEIDPTGARPGVETR